MANSKFPSNEWRTRQEAFKALRAQGVPEREAGIATFPELPPDTAAVQMQGVVTPTYVVDAEVPPSRVNRVMLENDVRANLVLDGMSPDTAKTIASGAAQFVPESGSLVAYDAIAKLVRSQQDALVTNPIEMALVNSKVLKDMQLAGHVLYNALGGTLQQGLYGLAAGESPSDLADRVWPDADIREDDGTVAKKALVPQALKVLGLGVGSAVFDTMQYGFTLKTPIADKARSEAEALFTEDYANNMLTAMEVVEYWMHGDGLVGTKLPDKDSPERAAYDAQVVEEASTQYAAIADERFGGLAMSGIALGEAVSEVTMDPGLWLSGSGTKAVELGRKLLPVSSRARVTSAIAERTGRLDQTLVALKDAKEWMKQAGEQAAAEGTPTNKARYAHAQKTVTRLQAQLDSFAAGPSETFLLPTNPRIHPSHIRPLYEAYHGVPYAQRKTAMTRFIKDRVRDAKREVKRLEKTIERTNPEINGVPNPQLDDLRGQLQQAIVGRDQWKQTQRWANSRIKTPGARTSAFLDEAVLKEEPYRPGSIDGLEDGMGFKPPELRRATEILDEIGPGRLAGGVRAIDRIARAMVTGAPAREVRRAIEDMYLMLHSNGEYDDVAELNELAALHAESLTQKRLGEVELDLEEFGSPAGAADEWDQMGPDPDLDEGLVYDQTVDELEHTWKYLAEEYKAVADVYDNPMALLAARITNAVARGKIDKAYNLMELVYKATEPVMSKGGELVDNAMQGHGKPAQVLGKGVEPSRDLGSTWDKRWEVERARWEMPRDVERSKKDVLKEILENIRRGVAQGAPEEELIQWERTYSDILRQPGDVYAGPVQRSTKPMHEILAESHADQRRRVMSEDPAPVADYTAADPDQLAQRVALGPDQREAAAEAAKVLAMGGEIDDIAYHGLSIDVYNSSYGEQLLPHSGNEARAAAVEWTGVDAMNTKVEAAQWQQNVAEKLGDFWAKGLYPGTWNINVSGLLYDVREPMRLLQSTNPRLYTRIHNALNAHKFELTRMNEVFARELKILGVYREVKGSYVLDPEASKRFYQVMNLVPGSEKYDLAMTALSETERRSLRRLRQELDFIGDKLGLRNTDKYIEGYIDHVWDRNWTRHGTRPPETRGYGVNTNVRNTHLMAREGNTGYNEDLAMALDVYARAASKKLHFEPMFKDMATAKELHLKSRPGDEWFATYIDDMIANFKGQPSTLGHWVDSRLSALNARMRAHEQVNNYYSGLGSVYEKQGQALHALGTPLAKMPGKLGKLGGAMQAEGVRVGEYGSTMKYAGMPLYNPGDFSRTAMGVTALIYSSVLGGSGRYFPMAVATGMATTGSRYGLFNTLRGILTMSTSEGRALAQKAGLDKQWVQIMEDAAWTKIGKLATNMPTFNGMTVVGPSISATENYVRGWTFHAALGDMMRKQGFAGWDEVVEAGLERAYLHEALRVTEEVNHLFGQLGKPPAFHRLSRSGSVGATQFLSFIPKQMEELMAQTLENPGRIAQYMMISGYIQRTVAKVGMDISDYVGAGFLPSSPDDATSVAMETASALVGSAHAMSQLAAGEGDAAATESANQRLLRALGNYIPLAIASSRATRTFDVLRTGSLYGQDGSLLYEFDLGGYEWDDQKSVGANLLESYNPEYLGGPSDPSEMAALKVGLNSPRQQAERAQYRALRTIGSERIYRRRQIADALQRMVDQGDSRGFDRQMALAEKEGMIPPDIGAMIERNALETALPRLLREQLDSDQKMLDAATTLPKMRSLFELKYNVEGKD